MKIRCFAIFLLLLATAFLLCACGRLPAAGTGSSGAPTESEAAVAQAPPYHIYCSMADLASYTNMQIARGIQDACERASLRVEMFDSLGDAAIQLQGIEQFAGVENGLVLCQPVDYAPLLQLFARLENAGTPVVTFGVQAGSQDAGLLIAEYDAGLLFAQNALAPLAEAEFAGRAAVVVLEYPATQDSPACAAAGIADGLAEALPRTSVRRYPVETSIADAIALALEDGLIDVLVGVDDTLALSAMALWLPPVPDATGTADASEPAAPPSRNTPQFAGLGAVPDALRAIADETLPYAATLDYNGQQIGAELVDALLEKAAGDSSLGQAVTPTVIDRENINDFINVETEAEDEQASSMVP